MDNFNFFHLLTKWSTTSFAFGLWNSTIWSCFKLRNSLRSEKMVHWHFLGLIQQHASEGTRNAPQYHQTNRLHQKTAICCKRMGCEATEIGTGWWLETIWKIKCRNHPISSIKVILEQNHQIRSNQIPTANSKNDFSKTWPELLPGGNFPTLALKVP